MNHTAQTGSTFIEILVSLLLISILLLGFDTLGFFSLEANKSAWYLNIATRQMSSIEERLRALGNFEGLKNQITAWNQENSVVLPGGIGSVSGKFPDYFVSLHWDGSAMSDLKEDLHL